MTIPYWLCGVNFKIGGPASRVAEAYTILTLWSQLQNDLGELQGLERSIPYWLCGVNFKIAAVHLHGHQSIYHTDSVESTSKWVAEVEAVRGQYTILTLWSQLQNDAARHDGEREDIPYWLCGVNFKILIGIYDWSEQYTILTLWSQLQNDLAAFKQAVLNIPYWLCGVNFKMELVHRAAVCCIYHTDSVESTSKCRAHWRQSGPEYTILTLWSQLQNLSCPAYKPSWIIPYWLCGVNFKIRWNTVRHGDPLYHTDSVESTSK